MPGECYWGVIRKSRDGSMLYIGNAKLLISKTWLYNGRFENKEFRNCLIPYKFEEEKELAALHFVWFKILIQSI